MKTTILPYYLKGCSEDRIKDELNAKKILMRVGQFVMFLPVDKNP